MAKPRIPKDPSSSSTDEVSSKQNGKRKMRKERKEKNNEIIDEVPIELKRPRLTWTNELHDQFMDAIAEIGLEQATPKVILAHMNVPGLSREHVASHLQKFREFHKKAENDSQADPMRSRHLSNDMHRRNFIPTGCPPLIYRRPKRSFQYGVLQQNPIAQPRFGALVGPPRFHYDKVGNNNFMQYRQLGPVNNNGNIGQLRMGNVPLIPQQTLGDYQNFGLGEPACVYNSNCATNHMERMVYQQPQGRPELIHTAPLGQTFNDLNSLGKNGNPYLANLNTGNTGSFQTSHSPPTFYRASDCPIENNNGLSHMSFHAANDVNPGGAYVGEMSTLSYDENILNEIRKGKKPVEESNMSYTVLNSTNVSTNSATQGESSSNAFLNPQQKLEGQGYYGLLNFHAANDVSPAEAYVGEMSTLSYDANRLNEIHKGKKPVEESNMSYTLLNSTYVSTNCATQGEISSNSFLNQEKFQPVEPPPPQQLEGQLNFPKNISLCGLSDFLEQGNQFKGQVLRQSVERQMGSEGILDSAFDPIEFLLNLPEINFEQELVNKDRSDVLNNLGAEQEPVNRDRSDMVNILEPGPTEQG